ncbi:MAG TPA: S41 family peptidase [Chthoniobacteraceae bacterium]|jgi:carboxyl-terminal processing protease|nr:S41 family peptidase [Chthoniobacteraceae bacterium]
MTLRFLGHLGRAGLLAGISLFGLARAQDAPGQALPADQPQTSGTASEDDSAYTNISVFTRALELIRQDYVDEKKVSFHDLTYGAMKGMMATLDPHSQFMDPADFKGMQDDTKSQFGGLGVVVSAKDGNLVIVSPMEDAPGFKAGLLPGDQILKIDGISADKMDLNDAIGKLRGDPGQKVTLTILRPSTKEIKDFTMEREIIKVPSVKDAHILGPEIAGDFKVGYVRITQFNEPTAADLGKKLDELEAQGMQALVIDLRYNPGGLLNSAVDVCGQFLPPHTMVVSTEGRMPSQKRNYWTSDTGKERPPYPIAILINGSSASGAEIVAGALKDLGRAILVGETSFGKGSVQSVLQLPDGSAMRLTTAKYYTPSHQVIHEHGVTPNIYATLTPEEERLLLLSRRDDMLSDDDQKDLAGFHDPQLDRAVDALKGVMIYAERTGQKTASLKGRKQDTATVQ